jgi:hypothetical protein
MMEGRQQREIRPFPGFLLLAIGLLLGGLGVYYWQQRANDTGAVPQQVLSGTAQEGQVVAGTETTKTKTQETQTYRYVNKDYGFSIELPKDYIGTEFGSCEGGEICGLDVSFAGKIENRDGAYRDSLFKLTARVPRSELVEGLVEVPFDPADFSLEGLLDQWYSQHSKWLVARNAGWEERVTIGQSIPAIRLDPQQDMLWTVSYLVANPNAKHTYELEFAMTQGHRENAEWQAFVQYVLASFAFVNE